MTARLKRIILSLTAIVTTQTINLISDAQTLSGCEICATTGQCNAAFHNSFGKYCGDFFSNSYQSMRPCCCPVNSVCKVYGNDCKCHIPSSGGGSGGESGGGGGGANNIPYQPPSSMYPSSHDSHHLSKSDGWAGVAGIIIMIIFMCICCCFLYPCHNRASEKHSDVNTVIPVATPVYGSTDCPAASAPQWEHSGGYQEGGGGGSGWAPALGGLAVGTLIGNMIGRSSGGGEHGFFSGESGGGGYDIAGDTGGDGGGYDIAGDTGGFDGGCDISGDT